MSLTLAFGREAALGAQGDRVIAFLRPGDKKVKGMDCLFVGSSDEMRNSCLAYVSDPLTLIDLADCQVRTSDQELDRWFVQCVTWLLFRLGDSVKDSLIGFEAMIRNAEEWVPAPHVDDYRLDDYPAICVASGPSLTPDAIERLHALQGHALILCADTALEPLLTQGITPDVVTPVERVPHTADYFPREDYGGIIFAGAPVVPHGIMQRFRHIARAVNTDGLYPFFGGGEEFYLGQSTGTCSVAVATRMTTGPIYLIGL